MRLLRKLKYILRGKSGKPGFTNINYQGKALKRNANTVMGVLEVSEDGEKPLDVSKALQDAKMAPLLPADPDLLPTATHHPRGRVVRVKNRPEFKPGNRHGRHGAVIRTMPRSLRKMKEQAEADDE